METVAWPETRIRRAAISSYGYGGSVSHAVIESAPRPTGADQIRASEADPLAVQKNTILILSAPQAKRLGPAAMNLKNYISGDANFTDLAAVAATLARRRGYFDHRCAIVVQDKEQAVDALQDFTESKNSQSIFTGRALGKDVNQGTVWVFSGHGAQWPDMGKQLLAEDMDFIKAVEPLDATIQEELGLSPIEALKTGDFSSSDHIQVLTYVMQIGLAASLKAKGTFVLSDNATQPLMKQQVCNPARSLVTLSARLRQPWLLARSPLLRAQSSFAVVLNFIAK